MKQKLSPLLNALIVQHKKIVAGLILIVAVTLPGELFHVVFKLLHLIYEALSFALEEFIQHVFHASKYLSQSIVFYLWIGASLTALYYLWRKLPAWLYRLKMKWLVLSRQVGSKAIGHWRRPTSRRKIKWLTTVCAGSLYLIYTIFD